MKGGVRSKVLSGGRDTPDFSINEEDIEVRIGYIMYCCAAVKICSYDKNYVAWKS